MAVSRACLPGDMR